MKPEENKAWIEVQNVIDGLEYSVQRTIIQCIVVAYVDDEILGDCGYQ